jgi:hypothetical protein
MVVAWLALAASLAAAQTQPLAGPAKQLADIRGSMERWVLMARPDAADPEIRTLARELTGLHQRSTTAKPDDAPTITQLQKDFDDWKARFANLAYQRRPEGAPNDPAVFRKQLERGIGGLGQLHADSTRANAQVNALKGLVSPTAFQWYVEGSKDRSGVNGLPGWYAPRPARAPAAAALTTGPGGSVPQGWTGPSDGGTDVQLDAPPDPAVGAGVAKIGERLWKNGGTVGSCYAGVKSILQNLGIVSSFWGKKGRDGEGRLVRGDENSGAYQFNKWVEEHPTLQNRKLLRIPQPAWPLQVSNVVVWGRGVCGYSDDWGHIEMIYKLSPDKRQAWAVSDHSQEFNVDCFKREAERSNAAASQLSALRLAVTQAQAAAQDKSLDRRAALAARRALAQKKAELSRAEQAAERVSVYRIGPPPPAAP